MKFGAIDIGTNAARLLIGEVTKEDGRQFVNKISYTRIPLRLGESVFETGRINKRKAEQFINTMRAFQLIAELFEVRELRACATSAMREAKNSKKIKKRIIDATGIDVEIISGEEEGELIFGTFFLMDLIKDQASIVVDVGGGSTEISLFANGEKQLSKSFEVGTLRLLKGKADVNCWNDIHTWLDQNISKDLEYKFFATGGNINKAHKMLGAKNQNPISFDDVKQLKEKLEQLTVRQRMEQYQLKPDRADVLVPALEIYCIIMEQLNCSEIIVPKIGLSDGIIYQLHKKHKARNK